MSLDLTKSILKDVRESVGLSSDSTEFDTELIMYINAFIGTLNQNGVGTFLVVQNEESKWSDLQDPLQVEGNKFFQMVPLFITLSTKLLFDPPPPSAVEHHTNQASRMLWQLKIAYEQPYVAPVVDDDM